MEEKKEMVIKPVTDDEIVSFFNKMIGFNSESLKSFVGKLHVLFKANTEAASSIATALDVIIEDIIDDYNSDTLTDSSKAVYSNSIRALITNMKKNYSADIKVYTQTHNKK